MIPERASGILLHPTSLPGPDGIGDLGPEAYRWIDFLHESGTQYWQILPLGPTGYGDSPYQCFSAFAGNPFLISPLLLLEEGLLKFADLRERPELPADHVDFGASITWKNRVIEMAFANFKEYAPVDLESEFQAFQGAQQPWLEDFSLFMAIKQGQEGHPWSDWPKAYKFRETAALEAARIALADEILKHKFSQFLFHRQWKRLRDYAHTQGIKIIGDMPFVIALDSADVWANPGLFLMDADLNPTMVAGVPPDYFAVTGQLWGNPLYKWDEHIRQGFTWWVDRLHAVLEMVDLVRLDHFRGFAAAWHVPFGNPTAIEGEWITGPSEELFNAFAQNFPTLPIIAEDLGVITDDVRVLRDGFGLPGMKILQFGFTGEPEDDFLPHHYPVNCAAYTGSHDNDTAAGWYGNASRREQDFCRRYLNAQEDNIAWAMIRAVWQSVAVLSATTMQDLLSLGTEARMNLPGSESGNWTWRMSVDALSVQLARQLRELNFLYGRLPGEEKLKYTNRLNQDLAGEVKPH